MGCCDDCAILGRLNSIEKRLNIYKTSLTGLSYFIPPTIHNLIYVIGYLVLDVTGEEVIVGFKVFSDNTVQISANIPLDGCTLYLY